MSWISFMVPWTLGYTYLFESWLFPNTCPEVGLQDHSSWYFGKWCLHFLVALISIVDPLIHSIHFNTEWNQARIITPLWQIRRQAHSSQRLHGKYKVKSSDQVFRTLQRITHPSFILFFHKYIEFLWCSSCAECSILGPKDRGLNSPKSCPLCLFSSILRH